MPTGTTVTLSHAAALLSTPPLLLLLLANASLAGGITPTVNPANTSFATNGTVTSLSTQLSDSGNGHTASIPLAPGSTVNVDFYNPAGTLIATKPFIVGPGGTVTIPGSSFPVGTTGVGSKVVYNQGTSASPPVKWRESGWSGISFEAFIDPLGLPGFRSPQSWFVDQAGVQLMSALTAEKSTVASSNFDLAYTNLGNGLFSAAITGTDSYLQLLDGTTIFFPDGTAFGELQYSFNDGITANGSFDFTGIGFSGLFEWDAGSNYASGTATDFSQFEAPTIEIGPEPGATALLGIAILGLCATVALKNSRKRREQEKTHPTTA